MKITPIENIRGEATFCCPDCGEENVLPEDCRISDLIRNPRKCLKCGVLLAWVPAERGLVSYAEMRDLRITRQILPFKRSRSGG